MRKLALLFLVCCLTMGVSAQTVTPAEVKSLMDRVLQYLNEATPVGIVDKQSGRPIANLTQPVIGASLVKSEYRIETHEWGLAYSAMLLAHKATGDAAYLKYTMDRMAFLSTAVPYFEKYHKVFPSESAPLEIVFNPQSLDDSGSLCAAMIKSTLLGAKDLQPIIDNTLQYIMTKQYRLSNGAFARNRPLPNTVWADDLYQSIPALAQAGTVKSDKKYFDECAAQIELYSKTVFSKTKGLFFHAWVQDMETHPEFYWARVNGWAMMAFVELLNELPQNHPERKMVLELFRNHVAGVAALQSGTGLWHQLLDRNDSFLETSASAMFTFCIAHAINRGWLDPVAFGPVALQGWKAVSAKVNSKGQVEGTSAGTSVSFDAAFYYNRPVGTGPHGYGSVLQAGAAMYTLLKERTYEGNPPMFRNR